MCKWGIYWSRRFLFLFVCVFFFTINISVPLKTISLQYSGTNWELFSSLALKLRLSFIVLFFNQIISTTISIDGVSIVSTFHFECVNVDVLFRLSLNLSVFSFCLWVNNENVISWILSGFHHSNNCATFVRSFNQSAT